MYKLLFSFIFLFLGISIQAQTSGFSWGPKLGLAVGFQQWNSFQNDALFNFHGDIFIESYDGPGTNALYAQIGYHVRGSSIRNRNAISITGNTVRLPTRSFEFYNLSFAAGFKQRFDLSGPRSYAYYLLAGRVDYNIGTNLEEYEGFNNVPCSFYPCDDFVTNWNYGLSLGGGYEFMFADLLGLFLEVNFSPDFSFQYKQPALNNVYDPINGTNRALSERKIRNFSLELTLGLRLLRVVEYIE